MSKFLSRLMLIARDRRGNIGLTFALLLGPMLMISGAAIDYSRLEHFKTATPDDRGFGGARGRAVYTSSGQHDNAVTAATNFATSNLNLLPGHVGTITPSISASLVNGGSNPGYT